MNKIILASLSLIAINAVAMGNRPPTDPATYGDIQAVQNQITDVDSMAIRNTIATQSNTDAIAAQQTQIDALSALKIQLGTTVRLYDAKYASLNFFSLTDLQGTGGNAVGLNVGLKLGKSYEQRLIEKQQKEIDFLMQRSH